jgi:hypothetical protein
MITSTDPPVADQAIWRGWVQRGKLRPQSAVRRSTVAVGILLLLGLGSAIYLLK